MINSALKHEHFESWIVWRHLRLSFKEGSMVQSKGCKIILQSVERMHAWMHEETWRFVDWQKKDASKMLKSLAPPDPKKMMPFFLENMRTTIKRVVAFANLLPGWR